MRLRTKKFAVLAAVFAFFASCLSVAHAGWIKVQDSPITIYRDTRTGLEWSVTLDSADNDHEYALSLVRKYGLRLPTWDELRDVVNNNDAVDQLNMKDGFLDLYETENPKVLAGASGGGIQTKRPRQPLITQTWILGVRNGNSTAPQVQPVDPYQKIYLLCEGDYNDDTIGEAVGITVSNMHNLFRLNLPENKLIIYNHSNEWTGPDFRNSGDNVANDIMTAIRNCPAGSSDTIVFFWHCHGSFDEGGHILWLSDDRSIAMYRSKIRRALTAKNARLTVLMTESCHSFCRIPYEYRPACAPPSGDVPPIFNSLFFNNWGVVDFNTSSPGQTSWNNNVLGAYFTHYFCEYINTHLNNSISWKTLLDTVESNVLNCPAYQKPPIAGHAHNYYYWSLPGCTERIADQKWSDPVYHPGYGDRITFVNNNEIRDEDHFRQVIRDSKSRVILNVIDHRTGKHYYLMTDLAPQGSNTRLGIYVEDSSHGGVVVTGVMSDTPGDKCRYLDNGDFRTK